jgi:hypothetical protein
MSSVSNRRRVTSNEVSDLYDAEAAAASQLTIHGIPKRSVHIPKRGDQNVFWMGICT